MPPARADLYWDVDNSLTMRFLRKFYVTGDATARVSHASMTLGRFFVPQERMPDLWHAMALDMHGHFDPRAELRFAPPLSEQHSRHFHFYLDLDMLLSVPVLPAEGMRRLAQVLYDEAGRFFPDRADVHGAMSIYVCTKSGEGKPAPLKNFVLWEESDQMGVELPLEAQQVATRLLREAVEEAEERARTLSFDAAAWTMAVRGGGDGAHFVDDDGRLWVRSVDPSQVRFRRDASLVADDVVTNPEALRLLAQAVVRAKRERQTIVVSEAVARELSALKVGSQTSVLVEGVHLRPKLRAFKHGCHIHWNPCVVDVTRALQIRRGVVLALSREQEELSALFGTKLGEAEWDSFVDESVYNTGLRMIGAPKACQVRNLGAAVPYRYQITNNARNETKFFAVDNSYYELDFIYENGRCVEHFLEDGMPICRDERLFTRFTEKALKATSVRCHDDEELTEGFFAHSGLHTVQSTALQPPGSKKKRGRAADDEKAEKKTMGKDHSLWVQITDKKRLDILRTQLLRHSSEYKNCILKAMEHPTKREIRVFLTNIGCTFCLNKNGFHSGNRAWMKVYERGDKLKIVASHMECYSTKEQTSGIPCSGFQSIALTTPPQTHVELFQKAAVVIADTAPCPSAETGSSSLPAQDEKPKFVKNLPSVQNDKAARRIAALLQQ